MKKIESLFVNMMLVGAVVATGIIAFSGLVSRSEHLAAVPENKYGAFLAAQHAIYVNDFGAAAKFGEALNADDGVVVQNVKMLSAFLSGKMPENVADLKKESGTPARLIYDAYLVNNDVWDEMYSRHKNDKSALAAPLRRPYWRNLTDAECTG